ncbi:MAG: 4-alpha-glucanotransferase [Myxococcota bacterium]
MTSTPRTAGILLHPTSLPGRHGIGDLGNGARSFIEFLRRSGLGLWQILPLVPAGPCESPYSSCSALAGNELLIDLDQLVEAGLLSAADAQGPTAALDAVDVEVVNGFKREALRTAARNLRQKPHHPFHGTRARFLEENPWVSDFALFMAIKGHVGGVPFWDWEPALRDRDPSALRAVAQELGNEIDDVITLQAIFDVQWRAIRAHATEAGVRIIGDVPLYVDADSADVWMSRASFQLDAEGHPAALAGAPPDYFSETGQLWGNPIYDWAELAKTGHGFWVQRMRRMMQQADLIRIDHFRGLSAYWDTPPGSQDARAGRWVKGPGRRLFEDLEAALGPLPLIAEDLGLIDDDVRALKASLGLPGMHVLQFAFGDDNQNLYLPHNHDENAVVYTGTHDNDTTLGWWQNAPAHVREHARRYLGIDGQNIAWQLTRAAFASVSRMAIVPMQDVLSLDGRCRMNTPGLAKGNWGWRVRIDAFNDDVAGRLRTLAQMYDRDIALRQHLLAREAATKAAAVSA